MTANAARHRTSLCTGLTLCAVLALAACRTGVPVIDPNPSPASVMGTITGRISNEDGSTGIAGRTVTAVDVETGERVATATTSETGGFTLKVPPARYRLEVTLHAGESAVKDPGTFRVSRSELEHSIDIRIGLKRAGATRIYQPPLPTRAPLL